MTRVDFQRRMASLPGWEWVDNDCDWVWAPDRLARWDIPQFHDRPYNEHDASMGRPAHWERLRIMPARIYVPRVPHDQACNVVLIDTWATRYQLWHREFQSYQHAWEYVATQELLLRAHEAEVHHV